MTVFPVIKTPRLLLRQITRDDGGAMFAYFSKDEVTQYYDLASFTELEQAEKLIDAFQQRYEQQAGIRWGITLHSNPERLIGSIGYHNWQKEHFKAEVGYELTPEYWRQGIMTEAMNPVLQYGFDHLELNRIEAFIDPHNISSRRLLEKSGLAEEGLLRDYFFEKGQFVDAVIFGMLKKERIAANTLDTVREKI